MSDALAHNDQASWFKTIWNALHAGQEAEGNFGLEEDTQEWNDICTAMAWIQEALESKDKRVTQLIRYNSEQIVRRRFEKAKADIYQKALQTIEDRLGAWLVDNTEEVFEEEPEIDAIRSLTDEAFSLARCVYPSDFDRP